MFSSKKIYHGQPTTSLTALTAAVPAGQQIIIKNLHAVNTSLSTTSEVSLYVAKSVEGVNQEKIIFNAVPYTSKERESLDVFIVLEEGDILIGKQTEAGAVTLYVSGVSEGN